MSLAVLFLPEFLETVTEIYFVVQVMVFSYLLMFFYLTFRDTQLLFGLSALIAGYFIFIHGLSTSILVIVLVFFILFGMQLQQVLMFGLVPLLGYQHYGDRYVKISDQEEAQKQQQAQQQFQESYKRTLSGQATPEEVDWVEEQLNQQEMQQHLAGNNQNFMQQQRLR